VEIQKLTEHNPWWVTKKVPDELKGLLRKGYELLVKSVEIREITIIIGVRRSGKSTLMYQMVDRLLSQGVAPEQIFFVNLEDLSLSKHTLDDIYNGYRNIINPDKKAYIFIDEIHRREGWESWIRHHYDSQSNCKFVISGSCSYLLKREYSTLLTGRNLAFEVFPLSFKEFIDFSRLDIDLQKAQGGLVLETQIHQIMKALNDYIEFGGFPAVFFTSKEFKGRLLQQYFDDMLYKDIIDRYNLNSKRAKDLALFLLTNFTGMLSLRTLRGALGLSYDTIKDYFAYFIEAYMVIIVDYFSFSMKDQKTRPSKVYCIDNGLRNAISFKFSRDEGKLVENLVLLELKRNERNVYYWKNKGEVDFVIKNKDQSLTAINVSYTDAIDARETDALLEFQKTFKNIKEIILITKNVEREKGGIAFIPLWKWLLR